MKSKAKLFVTIAAVFLAMVASAVAVVAVLAARNVTVNTTDISITYKAENVVGTVKGYYKYAASTDTDTAVSTFTSLNTADYDGSETDDEVTTWSFAGITGITRANNALFILYEFENESNEYAAECTYTNTNEDNIQVSYCVKTGTNYSDYSDLTKGGKIEFDVPAATVSGGTTINGVVSCIIKIEVVDVNFNADLEGASFSWALGYGAATT